MRVLVADDHPLYREAVARQITRLVPDARVAEAASMQEALAKANTERPGLFVFDYYMPGVSANAIAHVAKKFPDVPILIVSGSAGPAEVRAVFQAGVRGFLPKTATSEQFIRTIHLLLAGGTSVPPEMVVTGVAEDAPSWLATLTRRETDVLRATARGLSNKEIARELCIAPETVKSHAKSIFWKLTVRSRAQAVYRAAALGLI